ncbi:MAG TPA: hypothetical protein VK493_03825 [Bryobacteraceae bacterium]|nr:hypothetical protein [Bryobacteraceae bacterium]
MRSLILLVAAGLFSGSAARLPAQTADGSNALFARSSSVAPRISIANVEDRHEQRLKYLWIASIFAMAAGTGADAATSWHKRESNGLLASSDGTFGAKGLGIKAGLAGGVLLPQILFRKHTDLRTAFTIGNFAQAGIFTGMAVHNLGVSPPKAQ